VFSWMIQVEYSFCKIRLPHGFHASVTTRRRTEPGPMYLLGSFCAESNAGTAMNQSENDYAKIEEVGRVAHSVYR